MNSGHFCSRALLPAMVVLALQGCADVDPVSPSAAPPAVQSSDLIDRARQMINLPAYPANTEVQVTMILRNLPDMEVSELGPGTRAALYDCTGRGAGSCEVERDPEYFGTDYSHEFDGTFLAAVAIGGGSYTPPGAAAGSSAVGGGINWASITRNRGCNTPGAASGIAWASVSAGWRCDTLGIAYGAQNVRLYSNNYNTGRRRLASLNAGSSNPTDLENLQLMPTADRYLRLWRNAWSAGSWREEPRDTLIDTLGRDTDTEVHVLYFSPAFWPLEVVPGQTCVAVSSLSPDPSLAECASAAFRQSAVARYLRPDSSVRVTYTSVNFSQVLESTYDVLVDSANANAIFVVPAGDHGGEITDATYFASRLSVPDALNVAALAGIPLISTAQFWSNMVDKLNEVFFADGQKAPTNIFAWVPAVASSPTNVLPVVAVGPQGGISTASSQCGTDLADYCVAAPGFYFSITNGIKAGTLGVGVLGERAVLPNGDLLGNCVAPTSLEQSSIAIAIDSCYSSQTGPRLMWVLNESAYIRGAGDAFWDADSRTLTLPSPVGATEVAAAITTGALALIAAHFKSAGTAMSAADLLTRLRTTANKTGDYADTSIYGQGLIDVQAAISPQGGAGIALTEMARGARAPLDASALVLRSPLFGDALRNAFAGQTFIALDELHAPFRYSLESLLQSRRHTGSQLQVAAPLERSIQRLSNGSLLHISRGADQSVSLAFQQGAISMHLANDTHPGLGFGSVAESSDLARTAALQTDSALFAPWAAADRQWHGFGAEVALGTNQRLGISRYRALNRDDTDTTLAEDNPDAQDAVALTWQADFAVGRFGLQHVRSQSADELLGIEASGGLGNIADSRIDAANSWGLIDLSARSRVLFSLWHLRARADNLAQGALTSVQGLTADSWALAFMLSGAANTDLTLRLEQPLRARSGTLHFKVPTGYTPDRRILFSPLNADATPSGRELRLQADFSIQLGERGGRLQLSAGQAHEPGHIRNADNDPYALIGLSLPL